MPILIKCTGCQRQLRVPDHAAGKSIKCPACQAVFVATPAEAQLSPAPPPQREEPERPSFPVESSGEERRERQAFAERPLRSSAALPEGEQRRPRISLEEDEEDRPRRRPLRKKKADSSQGLIITFSIIGGLLLAAALGIGGYYLIKQSNNKGGVNVDGRPPVALGNQWKEFASPAGHYRVRMPGTPMHMTQAQDIPLVGKMTMHVDAVQAGMNGGYMVMYADFPGPKMPQGDGAMTQFFDGAIHGMANAGGGKVVTSRDISWKNHHGKEVELAMGGQGKFAVRMFLIGRRIFFLMGVGPAVTLNTPEVMGFFDSFNVDEAGL